jgi:hypothetical protein
MELIRPNLRSFYEKKIEKLVCEDAVGFGTHFLCMHNPNQFNQRIKNELNRLSYEYDFDMVRYKNYNTDHPKLNIFDKSDEFSGQKNLDTG